MTEVLPLTGFTVGVTADRRREELTSLLERRGARVIGAPTFRLAPLETDEDLQRVTGECIESPPDLVMVTTGIGFRAWMESADGWGAGDRLRSALGSAGILVRGPKARSAVRHAGLAEIWMPASESVAEMLVYMLRRGVAGLRIALQLHGEPLTEVVQSLESAGATVLPVGVYRWVRPENTAPIERMIHAILADRVDGVVFTSAPALEFFFAIADEMSAAPRIAESFGRRTVVVCIGRICAMPMERRNLPYVLPDMARLGSQVRAAVEHIPARRSHHVVAKGHSMDVRGHAVLVDGHLVPVPPASMAILRALSERPGRVYTRRELAALLPGDESGPHAVEMAVGRLRSLLPGEDLVETVVKRGYRLAGEGSAV